jgi:lipoprotein Spr
LYARCIFTSLMIKGWFILCWLCLSHVSFSQNDSVAVKNDTSDVFHFFKKFNFNISDGNFFPLYTEIYNLKDIPYRYGGRSESGIDCSGFAKKVYEKAYQISLPGSSSKTIFAETKNVKNGDMKEGDLVFFKIKKNIISHVGIYLGAGKFAHASTKGGIMVSDLSEPYYKKYFYKATRVLNQLLPVQPEE